MRPDPFLGFSTGRAADDCLSECLKAAGERQVSTGSEAARHRAKRRAVQDGGQLQVAEVPVLGSGQRLVGLPGQDADDVGGAQRVTPLLGTTMQQAAAMEAAMSARGAAGAKSAAGDSNVPAVTTLAGSGEAARHAAHRAALRGR